jgi:hypothetical protein
MTDKKQPDIGPRHGEASLQYAINVHQALPITFKAGQQTLPMPTGA